MLLRVTKLKFKRFELDNQDLKYFLMSCDYYFLGMSCCAVLNCFENAASEQNLLLPFVLPKMTLEFSTPRNLQLPQKDVINDDGFLNECIFLPL